MKDRKWDTWPPLNWSVRFSSRRKPIRIAAIAASLLILTGLNKPGILGANAPATSVPLQGDERAASSGALDWQKLNARLERPGWQFFVWDDQEGNVVRAATIRVKYLLQDGSTNELEGLTDERGEWRVEPPAAFKRALVTSAAKVGYVTHQFTAESPLELDLAQASRFNLSRFQDIAGIVVDAAGNPVAGAEVTAINRIEWGGTLTTRGSGEATVISDSNGRWRLGGLNTNSVFKISVARPGFASWTNDCIVDRFINPGWGAISLSTNTTLFLAKPTTIRGRVVDESGTGVPRASIWALRQSQDGFQTNVISGADGSFSVESIPPDYIGLHLAGFHRLTPPEIQLLVTAEGFAPSLRSIPRALPLVEGFNVVLGQGVRVEGLVVDQNGQPVHAANVKSHHGFQTLTDERGRFSWDHAPTDALEVSLEKEGYKPLWSFQIQPLLETNVITLQRLAQIRATVSDSTSRTPIESFHVTVLPETLQVIPHGASPYYRTNFTHGQLVLSPAASWMEPKCRLLIQARDYRTLLTDPISLEKGDAARSLWLQPEPWIRGAIVSQDGKPVEGATVDMVAGGSATSDPTDSYMNLLQRHIVELIIGPPRKTAADGLIELPRVPPSIVHTLAQKRWSPFGPRSAPTSANHDFLVVRHGFAFAEHPVDKLPPDGKIALMSPGSITGQVGAAPKAQPRYAVQVNRLVDGITQITPFEPDGDPAAGGFSGHVVCDAQGKFAAHGLLPGVYRLSVLFPLREGWIGMHETRAVVEASSVTEVRLLEGTRLARGRVVTAGDHLNVDWSRLYRDPIGDSIFGVRGGLSLVSLPQPKKGERLINDGAPVPLIFEADGSFFTGNLQPGTYELSLMVTEGAPRLSERFKRARSGITSYTSRMMIFNLLAGASKIPRDPREWADNGVPVGYLRSKVNVPPGSPSEFVDLGDFALATRRRLQLGAPAPAFQMKTFDGMNLQLSDYAGKWLTLVFWHSGAGSSSEAQLLELRRLWRDFEDDPRLALAMVALDEDPANARASARMGPACPHGYDGGWRSSKVANDYGIMAVPSAFLIDPKGTIAGYNLWAAPLKEVLSQVAAEQNGGQ